MLTALINSQFLRTSMRLFSSSAKLKNFELWYKSQGFSVRYYSNLKKLDTYQTFPAFLIYLSTLSKSALFDQTESLIKSGFAEDAVRVSAGGFVYPSVSRKPPCKFLSARTIWLWWKSHEGIPLTDSNGTLFMPNTYFMQELIPNFCEGRAQPGSQFNPSILRIVKGMTFRDPFCVVMLF